MTPCFLLSADKRLCRTKITLISTLHLLLYTVPCIRTHIVDLATCAAICMSHTCGHAVQRHFSDQLK